MSFKLLIDKLRGKKKDSEKPKKDKKKDKKAPKGDKPKDQRKADKFAKGEGSLANQLYKRRMQQKSEVDKAMDAIKKNQGK